MPLFETKSNTCMISAHKRVITLKFCTAVAFVENKMELWRNGGRTAANYWLDWISTFSSIVLSLNIILFFHCPIPEYQPFSSIVLSWILNFFFHCPIPEYQPFSSIVLSLNINLFLPLSNLWISTFFFHCIFICCKIK